jgi:ankyrin repeat protein
MRAAAILSVILSVFSLTLINATDITTAIDSGYVDQVLDILQKNPDLLNLKDTDALTPLNRASYKGRTEIVKLLLEKGADATIGDNENSQPIHTAAVAGHIDVLKILLESGVDIDTRDANGNTALMFSLNYSRFEAANWLIDKGADLKISNNNNVSPLIWASLRGQLDIFKKIVASGADLNHQAEGGRTALSFAAGNNQMEVAEYLLQSGADTEIPEDYGRTPLLWVARENGNAEMAALLVRYGANINARDRFGDTPLVLAAWRGFSGIVNLLLDSGAEVEITGDNSEELLNYSVEKRLDRLFSKLVEGDINLKTKSRYGSSMLLSAAQGGSVKIINTFIENGFDIKETDVYGWTPLHYAAWKGRIEAARLLIDGGADINARSLSGLTPFSLADAKNREEVKNLLISEGADQRPQMFPSLTGPYFGQKPPGKKPQLFAPDIVSTSRHGHSSVAFSPDGMEAYWSAYFFPVDSGYAQGAMVYSENRNGQWIIPKFPEFTQGIETHDDVPVFSKDGSKLYFLSRRPQTPGGQRAREKVWIVERTESGWQDPYLAPGEINNLDIHWQFSISDSGTLYIQGDRNDSHGLTDIYRSRLVNGEFTTPENIGSTINTPATETTPYIAPDESYLLFASGGHQSENNNIEIYVSFKTDDNKWSVPVRTGLEGLCPLVSHDGKYIFYNGHVNGIRGIYWVEASITQDLKPNSAKVRR